MFWKTNKPCMTDKTVGNENIIICDDSKIISK